MENVSNKKFDVSVILPLKSGMSIGFDDYFKKSIESLKAQKTQINELIIVHTDETALVEYLNSFDFGDLTVVKESWPDEGNYASQVNRGVSIANSKWVSLFEFDDEYSAIWFKNVKKYSEIYSDINAFLPIVIDVDEKSLFAGFTNEATFAVNMSSEIGFLTNETLHQYQNFQISGMVIKKDTFLEYGGMKSSFKLTFGYEFFLRMTYNSVKIMTIPKIGYKHINLRTGSIFWNYKNGENTLLEDEVKFWIESAKKEYFFTNDRGIKYEPQQY
jgi:glycosyltransferase involved in cell wall biosynthesis